MSLAGVGINPEAGEETITKVKAGVITRTNPITEGEEATRNGQWVNSKRTPTNHLKRS